MCEKTQTVSYQKIVVLLIAILWTFKQKWADLGPIYKKIRFFHHFWKAKNHKWFVIFFLYVCIPNWHNYSRGHTLFCKRLVIFYTTASSFLIYGHTIADCNDEYVPVYPPPPLNTSISLANKKSHT